MSLIEPTFWTTYRRPLIIAAICLVGLGLLLFILHQAGEWNFNRGQNKTKGQIANTVAEISNIRAEKERLDRLEAEKRGELNVLTNQLQQDTYGLDAAKNATNQALANYNRALASNTNVNASAEDLIKIAEQLGK